MFGFDSITTLCKKQQLDNLQPTDKTKFTQASKMK